MPEKTEQVLQLTLRLYRAKKEAGEHNIKIQLLIFKALDRYKVKNLEERSIIAREVLAECRAHADTARSHRAA